MFAVAAVAELSVPAEPVWPADDGSYSWLSDVMDFGVAGKFLNGDSGGSCLTVGIRRENKMLGTIQANLNAVRTLTVH